MLCMLEAVEGGLVCWRSCEVPEVSEVIRCVRLSMLEAVEGRLCSLEVLEVTETRLPKLLSGSTSPLAKTTGQMPYLPPDSYPLDCACGGGARGGGRLVEEVASSAKVRLSEEVVLMLLAVEASVVKEGSGSCY